MTSVTLWLDSNALLMWGAAGVLGLIVGSFLNVVIYRLPIMLQREWVRQCRELSTDDAVHDRKEEATFNLISLFLSIMVAIGEESGELDTMLSKVADIYEEEVDDAVAGLSSLLEPIIMVFLGVVIGGLVVAMYLPIFKIAAAI